MTQLLENSLDRADLAILSDRSDLMEELGEVDAMALALISNSRDCIKLLELDGGLIFMNANGRCAMAVDDYDAVRGKSWSALWPGAMHETISLAVQTGRRGGVARFMGICPTTKGMPKTWDVIVTPVYDAPAPARAGADIQGDRGWPAYLIVISKDVSAEPAKIVPADGIRIAGFPIT